MSLRKQGLTVVKLDSPDGESPPSFLPEGKLKRARPLPSIMQAGAGLFQKKVKFAEVCDFSRLLATAVSSGIPLRDAVESIAEDIPNPAFRKMLNNMVQQLHEGRTFSQALAEYPNVFGTVFISLVESAEEAGSMAETLAQLASYLERAERIKRKIQSVTAYPMFVLFFFILVCAIMTIFVIPRFREVFEGLGATLPTLTTVVFDVNRFLLQNALYIAAGIFVLGLLFWAWGRTDYGRELIDRGKLRLPVIGGILRKYAIARVSRSMSVMIHGGVPVTTAMEIASIIAGNTVLRQSLAKARERIMAGADISGSLKDDPQFPRLFVRMVSVGETSGKLPDVMGKLADVYEEQVEGQIMIATSLMEPLIICVFGGLVLLLILAIYMPVFTVASRM